MPELARTFHVTFTYMEVMQALIRAYPELNLTLGGITVMHPKLSAVGKLKLDEKAVITLICPSPEQKALQDAQRNQTTLPENPHA